MKNIVFVRLAPWFHYSVHHPQDIIIPFDIAYIAAMVDEKQYRINMIDNYLKDYTIDGMVAEILSKDVNILAISSKTPSIEVAVEVFKKIKESKSSIKTIAFGQHVTYMPETLLGTSFSVDAVVISEPEVTILELLTNLDNNSVEIVKGIAYWDKINGKLVKTDSRELIMELDKLPFMRHDLFCGLGYKKISINVKLFRKAKWGFLQTSRGCPYPCVFCSDAIRASYGKVYRARSPELVVNEMEYLVKNFKVNAIDFIDEVFTFNIERTEQICDEIMRRGLKVKWTVTTRADRLNRELVNKMKLAGCSAIAIGVESGSERILKIMNKGQTKEQIREAVKNIHNEGLSTNLTFIMGYPTETSEDLQETFNFAKELRPMFIQLHYLTPYPGTKIRKYYNWKGDGDFNDYSHFNACKYNISKIPDEFFKSAISNFYKDYYLSFSYFLTYLKCRFPYAIFNPGMEYQLVKDAMNYFRKEKKVYFER